MILVQVNIHRWALSQTLSNLRADARTAAIPIIVYGPGTLEKDVAREVRQATPATYLYESASSSDFAEQLLPFVKSVRTPPLSTQERTAQKVAAVYWLAMMGSRQQGKVFDLKLAESGLLEVTDDPAVSRNALVALGYIGTRPAQARLSDVSTNLQANPIVREVAADQLAMHIHRFGLLLDRDQAAAIHAAWDQAESPAVKSALAAVIGTLQPNGALVGERLQQFPIPPIQ